MVGSSNRLHTGINGERPRTKGKHMSTWLDDVKDPKVRAAYALVGNMDSVSLNNMIRALSLPISVFLNTPEDEERLKAAKVIRAYRRHRRAVK